MAESEREELVKIFLELEWTAGEMAERGLHHAERFLGELLVGVAEKLESQQSTPPSPSPSLAPSGNTLSQANLERFLLHYAELRNIERCPPRPLPGSSSSAAASFLHHADDRGHPSHPHLMTILSRLSISDQQQGQSAVETEEDPYLCWLRGVLQLKLGRPLQAAASFLQSLAARPYNWAAWVDLGDVVREFHASSKQREQEDASGGQEEDGEREEGWRLLAAELPTVELRRACRKVEWRGVCAQLFRGQLLMLGGRYREAGAAFGRAEAGAVGPAVAVVGQWRAEALLGEGRHQEGLAALRELRRAHPGRAEGLETHATALFLLGRRLGRGRELALLAEGALGLQQGAPERQYVLGAYLAVRGHLKSAALHLERATRMLPSFADAWYLLGAVLLLHSDDRTKALDCLFRAVRADPLHKLAWTALADHYPARLSHFAQLYRAKADALPSLYQHLVQTDDDDQHDQNDNSINHS